MESSLDASHYNRPKTGNSFQNSRGNTLHFRVDAEKNSSVGHRYLMFWVHGFGGHCNRPEVKKMAQYMNDKGVVVVSLDMEGHGYSDGERALILNYMDLVNDMLLFIRIILTANLNNPGHNFTLDNSLSVRLIESFRSLPFFIMGQSLGGGVTAFLSTYITDIPSYMGSVLLAPYLGGTDLPHWMVVAVLRYTMVSCAPGAMMPDWMHKLNDNGLTWKDEEVLKFAELDTWGKPGAVGYGLGMKWGTAAMFIDMGHALEEMFPQVSYPFLIVHDPDDAICSIHGSRTMIERSVTPDTHKSLIETPGYLHGLLCNHNNEVCDHVLRWIDSTFGQCRRHESFS